MAIIIRNAQLHCVTSPEDHGQHPLPAVNELPDTAEGQNCQFQTAILSEAGGLTHFFVLQQRLYFVQGTPC